MHPKWRGRFTFIRIAARRDEPGVPILSQFTGAARELPEMLIVNPHDADQCAAALQLALSS